MIKINRTETVGYPAVNTHIKELFGDEKKIKPGPIYSCGWKGYVRKFPFVRIEMPKRVS
jgi:hypothetical protein